MAEPLRFTRTNADIGLDDLPCLLNPVQAMDLGMMLEVTPAARRHAVMLAFAGLTNAQWAEAAGVEYNTMMRWMDRSRHLPWGAALRLAKVVGIPAEVLFKAWA